MKGRLGMSLAVFWIPGNPPGFGDLSLDWPVGPKAQYTN